MLNSAVWIFGALLGILDENNERYLETVRYFFIRSRSHSYQFELASLHMIL
ncbi:MAG: hypothetical protein SFY66_11910 [Oculatellaceae cyanobacterium bins.114]|nr:hypothetical protein [Oculatellaceae cyanobacterium bins.114]